MASKDEKALIEEGLNKDSCCSNPTRCSESSDLTKAAILTDAGSIPCNGLGKRTKKLLSISIHTGEVKWREGSPRSLTCIG